MSFLSKFLPKKKPVEIKNNIPKEKTSIKKTFAVYCHAHHGTAGDKLCPKCTALLATVMTRMNRCRYGINPTFADALLDANLIPTGHDSAGDLRAVELLDHPFFVATLFQPERAALKGITPPLVIALLKACQEVSA